MRINEAYEHDPILHYQGEESCPVRSCDKTGTQCVAITAPLTFTPDHRGDPHRHLPGDAGGHL